MKTAPLLSFNVATLLGTSVAAILLASPQIRSENEIPATPDGAAAAPPAKPFATSDTPRRLPTPAVPSEMVAPIAALEKTEFVPPAAIPISKDPQFRRHERLRRVSYNEPASAETAASAANPLPAAEPAVASGTIPCQPRRRSLWRPR